MQLTAKIKLQPSDAQADSLKRTLQTANDACNYISGVAWNKRTFGKFQLQKLVYNDVRAQFGLTAQAAIRCIAKVTDAYKRDRKRSEPSSHMARLPTMRASCPGDWTTMRFPSGQ